MKNFKKILLTIFLLSLSLTSVFYYLNNREVVIGDGYYLKNEKIFYQKKYVTKEKNNIKLLGKGFLKDDFLFYYKGDIFSEEVNYYRFVASNYFVTERTLFFYSDTYIEKIRKVDGRTFEFLENNYAKDKSLFYFIKFGYPAIFICKDLNLISDNPKYDADCGGSLYKQSVFVGYKDGYEDMSKLEILKSKMDKENISENMASRLVDGLEEEVLLRISNIPNIFCKNTALEIIEDQSLYTINRQLNVNGKNFYVNNVCDPGTNDCDLQDSKSTLIEKAKVEIGKNEYNVVDGCLYKNNIKVFDYSLLIKKIIGDFGMKYKATKDNMSPRLFWDNADEWFRVEDNNKIYIYLVGHAGCGGCIFNGPYIQINLVTGEVELKSAELPYIPNLFISPDMKSAVEVVFLYKEEGGHGDIELYLYSFMENKRKKLLYMVPQNKTILSSGDGIYPINDSIIWKDDRTIKITTYEKSDEKWNEAIEVYESIDGETVFTWYKNPDEPIEVQIK